MKPINSLKMSFQGDSGFLLDARLDLPKQTPSAFAIFCHCFTCNKQTLATHRISRLLAAQGIAVLRFDFTGLGQSEGDFANTNMVETLFCAEEEIWTELKGSCAYFYYWHPCLEYYWFYFGAGCWAAD